MTSSDFGHGGDIYAKARALRTSPERLLDLSGNASAFARPLTGALVDGTPYPFAHYPDLEAADLTRAIAAHEGTDATRCLTGNGGAELIRLAIQVLAPRKVLLLGPIFSEYAATCALFGIPCETISTRVENRFDISAREMEKIRISDADMLILCTPNNPTGTTYENIDLLLGHIRTPRILADLSYREFLHGTEDYRANSYRAYLEKVQDGVKVFTLHSFTKFFCCPGIRLGYILGEAKAIRRMAALQPPWSVSPFAQVMGIRFLENIEEYRQTLPALRKAVLNLGRDLRRMDFLDPDRVTEGPGFLCCGLRPPLTAKAAADFMLKRRILIRDCDNISGMPGGYVRVRAGREEETAELLAAFKTFSLALPGQAMA
ncbi:MAG: aminotransferase class I/II-fold pyridoxal phosphate-dependent enzyme [Desulfovibrio sp.]|jgi:threonine-phosphate decarboxylase|nr:aminotransferase class I/II-fold pyridoxal phosphate-dependent enzyme [Desulfovibrio sp.]